MKKDNDEDDDHDDPDEFCDTSGGRIQPHPTLFVALIWEEKIK